MTSGSWAVDADPDWSGDGWIAVTAVYCGHDEGCSTAGIAAVRANGAERYYLGLGTAFQPRWRP